jgi:glucose/arabinose dehydrogenase
MTRVQLVLSTLVLSVAALTAQAPIQQMPGVGPNPTLPEPKPDQNAKNFVKVVGWPKDATPEAPDGFTVTRFADGLQHPRWLYRLPNGDILVAEAATKPKPPKTPEDGEKNALMKKSRSITESADRITLLRDANADGIVEQKSIFLQNLNQPFGMVLVSGTLYVANTDSVMAFPYQEGQVSIQTAGKKILTLPAGGYNNHWTRNIIANKDGSKLYISVGSASNIAEHGMKEEENRAAILECNLDGSGLRVFASGLRNPNGMDWHPDTGALWTVVNERDGLGDDLPPDYLTRVDDGAFYGWPYSYWGKHVDTRVKPPRPDLVAKARVPDYALGSHTAALGLTFYADGPFPARYHGGAFIGQHGSWNRTRLSGYQVLFVPFKNGQPAGEPEAFMTGFVPPDQHSMAYGRPVGVIVDKGGALLVADDAGNVVWRVSSGNKGTGN